MQMRTWTILSFGLVAIAASAYAAGCRTNGCNVDPDCDSQNTNTGAGGAGGSTPDSCIPKTNQEVNKTAVKDECGVFVRLAGDDTAAGTKGKPFATIAHAIETVMNPPADSNAKTRRIYVCAEQFEEALEIHSEIEIYGGLNCAGGAWAYSNKRTTIAPQSDMIPIKFIKDNDKKIHLEDITANAADASVSGGSSIAATADAVTLIELVRVDLVSGSAQSGDNGTTPSGDVLPLDPTDLQIAGANGNVACTGGMNGNVGPTGTMNPFCSTSIGGTGGTGLETMGTNGTDGQVLPADNPLGFGLGGAGSMGLGCQAGKTGAVGDSGTPGLSADQEVDVGNFDLSGYKGKDGSAGGPGKPGQGGGGGGGAKGKTNCYGASGGAGAAGGCGGAGGTGGKSGGSSIALISIGATFVFEDVKLISGSGGNGGDGGDGQAGGIGGVGGKGGPIGMGPAAGCAGGDGGLGGMGGKGGGGRGGHSIGIVWQGVPPPDATDAITFGQAGGGGLGDGASKGLDGKAQATLQLGQ